MDTVRKRDSPPAGFSVRPARHEDIPAIIALMAAFDASFGHTVMSFEVGDIEDDWRDLDLEKDTWVTSAPDGTLTAYATLTDEGLGKLAADGYVHPLWRGKGLGELLLDLTEARARELIDSAPEGARVTLFNSTLVEDEGARGLLERAGYELARVFWRMRLEMAEAPPAPQWPVGAHVRTFDPARDARAVHAVVEAAFADHWGHTPEAFEEWAARTHCDTIDPSLWFLVEDEAGSLVSVSLCRMRPEQGWIRAVATVREWRKRGLARALLLHCFGEFWARGQRVAGLGVDSQSLTGAAHLYEEVGMRPDMRIATYEKILRPGENLVARSLHE